MEHGGKPCVARSRGARHIAGRLLREDLRDVEGLQAVQKPHRQQEVERRADGGKGDGHELSEAACTVQLRRLVEGGIDVGKRRLHHEDAVAGRLPRNGDDEHPREPPAVAEPIGGICDAQQRQYGIDETARGLEDLHPHNGDRSGRTDVRDKKEDGEQLSSLDLLREHRGDNDGDDKPHDMRERHFQTHKKGLPERKVGERFPEVRKRIPADRCDVHAVHVAEHGHDGNTYGNRREKQEPKERNGGKRRSAHLLLPAESAIFA